MTMAVMPAIAGGSQEPAIPRGTLKEEVVISVARNPDSLDPHWSTINGSRLITQQMYNSLVYFNTNTKQFEPMLAERWQYENDSTIVFYLRRDVLFHDGRPMTAKDVKYSLDRCATMPGARSFVTPIKSTEILDQYTIRLSLQKPTPAFLGNLSHAITSIIPDGSGDTAASKPIGTGPFKLMEWLTDSHVLLERHDAYFGGLKPSKRLRFRIIPDNTARNLALEAKDIDIGIQVNNADRSFLENNPAFVIYKTPSVLVEYFAMNVEKPPFNDIHVRRAVAHALNIGAVIDVILGGDVIYAKSLINSQVFAYNDQIRTYDYNLDKAKAELAKSKYPNGFEFKCYTTNARGRYAESLQYDLSRLNIKMQVEFVENVQMATRDGYTGAHITSINYPDLDPDVIYRYLHSTQKGPGGNLTWYSNPQMDALLDQGRSEMNVAKRAAIYTQIQNLIAEDVPLIPMYTNQVMTGTVRQVGGYENHPTTVMYFHDVYYKY
jgi:peptide/nickel transport system substrate-binding protein